MWRFVRKKKKNKAKEVLEAVEKSEGKSSEGTSKSRSKKTPAELAFIKTQEKRVSFLAYVLASRL